jgi:hypothetical protein
MWRTPRPKTVPCLRPLVHCRSLKIFALVYYAAHGRPFELLPNRFSLVWTGLEVVWAGLKVVRTDWDRFQTALSRFEVISVVWSGFGNRLYLCLCRPQAHQGHFHSRRPTAKHPLAFDPAQSRLSGGFYLLSWTIGSLTPKSKIPENQNPKLLLLLLFILRIT